MTNLKKETKNKIDLIPKQLTSDLEDSIPYSVRDFLGCWPETIMTKKEQQKMMKKVGESLVELGKKLQNI